MLHLASDCQHRLSISYFPLQPHFPPKNTTFTIWTFITTQIAKAFLEIFSLAWMRVKLLHNTLTHIQLIRGQLNNINNCISSLWFREKRRKSGKGNLTNVSCVESNDVTHVLRFFSLSVLWQMLPVFWEMFLLFVTHVLDRRTIGIVANVTGIVTNKIGIEATLVVFWQMFLIMCQILSVFWQTCVVSWQMLPW